MKVGLGRITKEASRVILAANPKNSIAADGNCLRDGFVRVHGDDNSMVQDKVGFRRLREQGPRAEAVSNQKSRLTRRDAPVEEQECVQDFANVQRVTASAKFSACSSWPKTVCGLT